MTGDSEGDLPLHDEAEARSKWRGEETLPDKGLGTSGPASELDDAAHGRPREARNPEDGLLKDLAQSPPD